MIAFNGLFDLSYWQIILITLALTHITIVSVTVYLHRYSAHRAIELHPALKHFFRFWLWFATSTNTKEWTSIHRKHHAKCETPEDPHSPVVLGINKVLWEGAEVYQKAAKNQDMLARYGAGCPEDWLERNLYSRYKYLGIFLMFVLDVACFGAIGITVWAVQMIWIPFFAAGVINGLGHHAGYRNFECKDASTNLVPWGILIGGEELHNNHHTYPGSAKLSVRPWEFDVGYAWIRLFEIVKLAKVRKLPPKTAFIANKQMVDVDTLKALVSNRFQVMAGYRRNVIAPVIKTEKQRATAAKRRLLARGRNLFHLHDKRISEGARKRLESLLENNPSLEAIYNYRQRLQQIANRAGQGSQETLDALREWIKDAEASGIEVLADFARQLQGYVPAKAIA